MDASATALARKGGVVPHGCARNKLINRGWVRKWGDFSDISQFQDIDFSRLTGMRVNKKVES
jgi:hypothetical protein